MTARRLKVMMVSTTYPCSEADWRGRFIYDMVSALSKRDDIELRLWAPPGPLPQNVRSATTDHERDWLRRMQTDGGAAQAYRSGGLARLSIAFNLLRFLAAAYRRNLDVDIFHVNWLQNSLPLFGTTKPVLATCLGTDLELMGNRFIAMAVGITLRQRPFLIAPNAEWMRARLIEAVGIGTPVKPIYFGVDERWFGLNENRILPAPRRWLVVSRVTKNKIGSLLEWGQQFVSDGDELHLLGPMQEPVEIPDWIQYHGPTNPEELAKKWFPQTTALVTLSQHSEGLPQVILEAMAARIPVIATRIPGHEAALQHGVTGFLVDSEQQLSVAISELRDAKSNIEYGRRAHQWVREMIGTWSDCADRFVIDYGKLTSVASAP